MKIVDITTDSFRYKTNVTRDSEGHTHAGDENITTQTLMTIITDEGAKGYAFGGTPGVMDRAIKPALVGEDPMYREKLWQRLKHWQRIHRVLNDYEMSVADMALWDLAGRYLNQPVYKLLGAHRDKVLAYASTMCGDEIEGGLGSPEDYARYAEQCMSRGYKAFKLHTWMPPISWAPDPRMDIKACAAVREAVGPDMPLMLDAYHYYSRNEALYIGRELQALHYHWYEEPMDERTLRLLRTSSRTVRTWRMRTSPTPSRISSGRRDSQLVQLAAICQVCGIGRGARGCIQYLLLMAEAKRCTPF